MNVLASLVNEPSVERDRVPPVRLTLAASVGGVPMTVFAELVGHQHGNAVVSGYPLQGKNVGGVQPTAGPRPIWQVEHQVERRRGIVVRRSDQLVKQARWVLAVVIPESQYRCRRSSLLFGLFRLLRLFGMFSLFGRFRLLRLLLRLLDGWLLSSGRLLLLLLRLTERLGFSLRRLRCLLLLDGLGLSGFGLLRLRLRVNWRGLLLSRD